MMIPSTGAVRDTKQGEKIGPEGVALGKCLWRESFELRALIGQGESGKVAVALLENQDIRDFIPLAFTFFSLSDRDAQAVP